MDVDALSGMTDLDHLGLSGNASLGSLTGLRTAVQGDMGTIGITENGALTNLAGLEGVARAESVLLQQNASLESLVGLRGLATIASELLITGNPGLTDLRALGNLTDVGEMLRIVDNAALRPCEVDWLLDSIGTGVPSLVLVQNNGGQGSCP